MTCTAKPQALLLFSSNVGKGCWMGDGKYILKTNNSASKATEALSC